MTANRWQAVAYRSARNQKIRKSKILSYPSGWYILRVQAGEKVTEFKIVKQ
jgi:hypothetical protein